MAETEQSEFINPVRLCLEIEKAIGRRSRYWAEEEGREREHF
jgi:hypothetical protein